MNAINPLPTWYTMGRQVDLEDLEGLDDLALDRIFEVEVMGGNPCGCPGVARSSSRCRKCRREDPPEYSGDGLYSHGFHEVLMQCRVAKKIPTWSAVTITPHPTRQTRMGEASPFRHQFNVEIRLHKCELDSASWTDISMNRASVLAGITAARQVREAWVKLRPEVGG